MTEKEASAEKTGAHAKVEISSEEQTKKKMSTGKKVLIIVCASILGLLLTAYGAGAAFFSSHFYPNTTFNDEDISFDSDDEFVSQVEALVPSYMLTISGGDFLQQIRSDQIDLKVDQEKLHQDAVASRNIWLWPVEVFADHDMGDAVQATFNHDKVDALLTPAVEEYNKTATPSVDATLAYSKDNDSVFIQEEIYGDQIDLEAFLAVIDTCLTDMEESYELTGEVYVQPLIFSNDARFLTAIPAANELISGEIDLTMAEGAVSAGKIDKELLVTWLTLDPETFTPTLDQAAVAAWADQRSLELNTVGTSRTFTRGDGKNVTVSGGVYGWKVDTANLASTIIGNVTSGNFDAIDIPCSQTADVYSGPGGRDWGAYVDIDISEQKVRYFNENDELLFVTDCVTGDATRGRSTPSGLYYLRAKKSPEVLTGYNPDGTKSYESHVTYWMPFIRNSIGLHDSTWRTNFGGSIYKGNGSHGCVNLPTDAAKWFYENLSTNVAVLVHE